ncbi:MAG: carbohydrate kinase family protein [Candidatus Doudnabacteria bacterium]
MPQAQKNKKKNIKTKYDIISIGDATIDTFLFVNEVDVKKSKGRLWATISWGDKLPVQEYYRTVAGNAANNAVGSSRLGLKAAFYTVLAHDTGGREIVHKMKKEKVATEYVVVDEKHPTNASTVLSHEGERTIFVYHEHRKYKLPKLAPAKWIYLTSMANGFEKIHKDLAAYIDKYDVKVGFNPGTFQLRKGPKFNKAILERTTVLSINKEEAQDWVGKIEDPEELCKRLIKLGPESIALTDGPKGAYSYSAEGFFWIPQYPGPRKDATGAGDSFTTAYIAALILGKSYKEALSWGPINAGSVVSQVGPQAGLLTQAQLKTHMRKLKNWKPIVIDSEKAKSQVMAKVGKIK